MNSKDLFDLREKEVKAGMRINTLMELISARKTSHNHSNKDPSRLR